VLEREILRVRLVHHALDRLGIAADAPLHRAGLDPVLRFDMLGNWTDEWALESPPTEGTGVGVEPEVPEIS
jgi:hypothetical protein